MLKYCSVFFVVMLVGLSPLSQAAEEPSSATPPEGMVLIPAGAYEMGSRKSLLELDPTSIFQHDRHMLGPEDPAHEVILDGFFIDRHETTNAEYRKYIEKTGARTPRYMKDAEFNQPSQPVVGIDWKEAEEYCRWRGKRLPTEAEWEKAGRGQAPVKYPWGNEPPDETRLNFNGNHGKTQPVGSFENGKSAYGVYDLSGNVAEWVADWHFPEYYLFSPKENPPGPEKGTYKVIRGGNWRSNGEDVRLTYRNATTPKIRNNGIGFRCVKDLAGSTK